MENIRIPAHPLKFRGTETQQMAEELQVIDGENRWRTKFSKVGLNGRR